MKLVLSFTLSILLLVSVHSSVNCQNIPTDKMYLGQNQPGTLPVVFNLHISDSKSFIAERIAISKDNKEIYYTELDGYPEMDGKPHTMRIKYFKFADGKWNGPEVLFEGFGSPTFSPKCDTLFVQNTGIEKSYFSVRTKSGWTPPRRILSQFKIAHYLQETDKGNFFIGSIPGDKISEVDKSRLIMTKTDTTITSLGAPINTKRNGLDFFVAKDESYIIIAHMNKLKISFRTDTGKWSEPAELGKEINFGLAAWGPIVTSDGKFLFYTTGTKEDYSDTRIHWVNIEKLFEKLRNDSLKK